MTYAASEIMRQVQRGPSEGEDFYRLKITGKRESRWVNVTEAQAIAIAAVLDADNPA